MEPSRPQRALDFGELRVDARGLGSLWPVANQLDIHTFAHKVWRTSALSQDAEETVTTKKETPKLNRVSWWLKAGTDPVTARGRGC